MKPMKHPIGWRPCRGTKPPTLQEPRALHFVCYLIRVRGVMS